jgi:predicted tellurium resistance membrane protein TerC
MFEFTPEIVISFLTLVALEVVLGIDNLILISILTDKLPPEKQPLARRIGIMGAVVTRLLLLSLIFVMVHLREPLFTFVGWIFHGVKFC